MRKFLMVLTTIPLVSSCVHSSQIVSLDKDTHTISATAHILNGLTKIKKTALMEANIFCADQKKDLVFIDQNSRNHLDEFVVYELTFKCAPANMGTQM